MIGVSADADEFLDVRVPGGDIVVRDRPVHPVSQLLGRDELVLAPALTRAAPDDGLAAHLITTDPVERPLLDVRMATVLDEEMHGVLAITGRLAEQRGVLGHPTRPGA